MIAAAISPADYPNDISEHHLKCLWKGQVGPEELQSRCCAGVWDELFSLVLRVGDGAQPRHNQVRGLS